MTDRRTLDRIGADGCPPLEQVEVDGWRLRAAGGVLLRANSAMPLSDALPLAEVVDFYRSRGLTPRVHVSSEQLDGELAARGWERQSEVDVLLGPTPAGRSCAVVADTADPGWVECWWAVDGRGGADQRATFVRMLERIAAPAAYAAVVVDGAVVAVGRAVAQEGHLGVFAMAVLPGHRRRGLGREVLHALGTWGLQQGAATTYLQVLTDNSAAGSLYAEAGLSRAYRYHYRALT